MRVVYTICCIIEQSSACGEWWRMHALWRVYSFLCVHGAYLLWDSTVVNGRRVSWRGYKFLHVCVHIHNIDTLARVCRPGAVLMLSWRNCPS